MLTSIAGKMAFFSAGITINVSAFVAVAIAQSVNSSCCIDSKEATGVRDTAMMVKEALEQAEKAQNAATEAIKQATTDIKGTQDLLVSVSTHSSRPGDTVRGSLRGELK